MRIIILGASGQIGSFLFEDLRSKYTVTGTSRKSSTSLLRFDPFLDDWSALGEADVVINCIGQIQESSSCSFKKIHLGISKKLIENRMLLGDPRIIQISALGASAIHPVEFLRTKGEADDYLLQFPDTVVARPSCLYIQHNACQKDAYGSRHSAANRRTGCSPSRISRSKDSTGYARRFVQSRRTSLNNSDTASNNGCHRGGYTLFPGDNYGSL